MCGIIGLVSKNKKIGLPIFRELLLQSQIRGKHSTGYSFLYKEELKTITKPLSAENFLNTYDINWSHYMIGHVRYSTSHIKHNQPIMNKEEGIAITHNGIISQTPPERWEEKYGYSDFVTKNDSELLLKCLVEQNNPFKKFPNSSMACGILREDTMYCFRNNTRPLWLFIGDGFAGFASTRDIIERTMMKTGNKATEIINCEPFSFYEFQDDPKCGFYTFNKFKKPKNSIYLEDQQISTKTENKYKPCHI